MSRTPSLLLTGFAHVSTGHDIDEMRREFAKQKAAHFEETSELTGTIQELEKVIKRERAQRAQERSELEHSHKMARANAQARGAAFSELEDAFCEALHVATLAVRRHKVPCDAQKETIDLLNREAQRRKREMYERSQNEEALADEVQSLKAAVSLTISPPVLVALYDDPI